MVRAPLRRGPSSPRPIVRAPARRGGYAARRPGSAERDRVADYTQTHVVPTEGLPAWPGPDGSTAPAATLDPGLDVMVLERRADWALVRCSNGWEAWVDGRRLVESAPGPAPTPTPSAPPPPAATAAPAPTQPTPAATAAPPPTPAPPPTQPVPQAAPAQPGPPSAVWGASGAAAGPGAAPGAARTRGGFRIGPGQIVALAGGFVFFVSSWMEWLHVSVSVGQRWASLSYSSDQIAARALLDAQSNQGGLNLGILIAVLGVACLAAALLSALGRPLGILTIAAGGVSFLVMVLFFVQTGYAIDALPAAFEKGYFSVLRYGALVAMLAAVATLIGGILSLVQWMS